MALLFSKSFSGLKAVGWTGWALGVEPIVLFLIAVAFVRPVIR